MIKAQHIGWAHLVFHPYITRLIRRHFHSLYLMKEFPRIDPGVPILLLPNHSTWWDGFFIYLLNHYGLRRPLYLMMLEEQLSKYPFFAKLGAYSIDPGRPKSVLETMKYTQSILASPQTPAPLVCLFPQGEMQPVSVKTLKIRPGYEWLLKNLQTEIIPLILGIRAEFLEQQQPEVFFQFSTVPREESLAPENIQRVLENILEEMLESILKGNKGNRIAKGRRSVNEMWDSIRMTTKKVKE